MSSAAFDSFVVIKCSTWHDFDCLAATYKLFMLFWYIVVKYSEDKFLLYDVKWSGLQRRGIWNTVFWFTTLDVQKKEADRMTFMPLFHCPKTCRFIFQSFKRDVIWYSW